MEGELGGVVGDDSAGVDDDAPWGVGLFPVSCHQGDVVSSRRRLRRCWFGPNMEGAAVPRRVASRGWVGFGQVCGLGERAMEARWWRRRRVSEEVACGSGWRVRQAWPWLAFTTCEVRYRCDGGDGELSDSVRDPRGRASWV